MALDGGGGGGTFFAPVISPVVQLAARDGKLPWLVAGLGGDLSRLDPLLSSYESSYGSAKESAGAVGRLTGRSCARFAIMIEESVGTRVMRGIGAGDKSRCMREGPSNVLERLIEGREE